MTHHPSDSSSAAINLQRLVLLRWLVLAGQALAVWGAVGPLGVALPWRTLAAVIAVMALINLGTGLRLTRPWPVSERELFAQLLLDVAAFTVLLYLSGGSSNPFVTLYLLPLALTAAALPAAYTWTMAGVTSACYTVLHFYAWQLPAATDHRHHASSDFGLHVLGMWVGFVLSAAIIAGFAVRMAATVRARDQALAAMREQQLKHERILALGTLAAGAAHELGTPLSTMAVLLKDLKPAGPVPAESLAILRDQVARCKEILQSLSASAGATRAESGASLALDDYLRELVRKWLVTRPGVRAEPRLAGSAPAPRIVAEQTLSQAITNLLNNAADASPDAVEIEARWTDHELTLEIADRGAGLAPEAAQQAGAAIFTTKEPGAGLGLGLFLAYTTLSRLGGAVRLLNRDGGGVLCRLTLPLAQIKVST
jgi:two-component system sensor histidine kinase RegB